MSMLHNSFSSSLRPLPCPISLYQSGAAVSAPGDKDSYMALTSNIRLGYNGTKNPAYLSGVKIATFHFLCSLWICPISQSVCPWQDFPVLCSEHYSLLGLFVSYKGNEMLWRMLLVFKCVSVKSKNAFLTSNTNLPNLIFNDQ